MPCVTSRAHIRSLIHRTGRAWPVLNEGRADFIGRPKANEMKLSRCIVDMRRASLAPSRAHHRLRLRGTKGARCAKPRAADSARASAHRFDAGHLADQGVERLEIDRLGEVREEP